MPSSAASSATRPSRTMAWSSTTTTRIGPSHVGSCGDPSGSRARTTVPPVGGQVTSLRPPSSAARSRRRPGRRRPGRRGDADAVVGDLDTQRPVGRQAARARDRGAPAWRTTLVSASPAIRYAATSTAAGSAPRSPASRTPPADPRLTARPAGPAHPRGHGRRVPEAAGRGRGGVRRPPRLGRARSTRRSAPARPRGPVDQQPR